jgi:hypothetical protein
MYVYIVDQAGTILVHRNMQASPETFLKVIAPYRDDIVVAVAGLFTWDLARRPVRPRGHSLCAWPCSLHEGHPRWKATNDTIDAQKIVVLLRSGMLPPAYVYPAGMRATRDLLRRRMYLMRKRAELLTHVQNTNSQYNLPSIGKKIAYKANRTGVAERFPDPAVQKSIA